MPSIEQELKQGKPIAAAQEAAYLNVQRTANVLEQGAAELLRSADLTPTQYNVLRILRGAGEVPLTAGEVGERMVTRDPDVTRMLDRLEKRALVERRRGSTDRRVVWNAITPAGRALIAPLDSAVVALHQRQFEPLSRDEVTTLIHLLERLRGPA